MTAWLTLKTKCGSCVSRRLSLLRTGHHTHSRLWNALLVPCIPVCFPPHAESHLSSKSCLLSRSPDLPSCSSPDGCLASAAGVSHHSMGAAMWHGGSLMHLLSFHDINSLRWSVSCQNCWEKRQAVLSLPRLTWRKHNLVSVFTLPSLGMYLAHLICLLSVIAWMILDFLLHTHTHSTNTPRKYQISNYEQSVLWEIH